ncbi:MAG: GFA family protein [Parvibaculaceae bacterium]
MTENTTAACACGQLRVTLSGPMGPVSACCCDECRKNTGGAYGLFAGWPNSALVSIEGDRKAYRRSSASGRWIESWFCPACGSTVYWYGEAVPDEIGISLGTLPDPGNAAPADVYWAANRADWVSFPTSSKLHDSQP